MSWVSIDDPFVPLLTDLAGRGLRLLFDSEYDRLRWSGSRVLAKIRNIGFGVDHLACFHRPYNTSLKVEGLLALNNERELVSIGMDVPG